MMGTREKYQSHACQDADDDVGEVQHAQVGAGEEDDVYKYDAEEEASDAGKDEKGPGKVQQVWGRKKTRNAKRGPWVLSMGERVPKEVGNIHEPSPLQTLHPHFKKIGIGL